LRWRHHEDPKIRFLLESFIDIVVFSFKVKFVIDCYRSGVLVTICYKLTDWTTHKEIQDRNCCIYKTFQKKSDSWSIKKIQDRSGQSFVKDSHQSIQLFSVFCQNPRSKNRVLFLGEIFSK
jgi:hypothetical protein